MAALNESSFAFDELFFSKTDKKGIIQSGNSVFQRVSEFSWEDLQQKPHNIIRHPDMPKGVFHLLWEYLKADRPIGAFVKNRSKTGKHYWVFALAMPVKEGYLSVRIKPGGDLLASIEGEYAALRSKELADKITPLKSQEMLLERLSQLGFPDYTTFMTHALFNQIENRCREINVHLTPAMSLGNELRLVFMKIMDNAKGLMNAYRKTKHIPLNLEIQSSAFGEDGRQLSVVASQYQKMVGEINHEIGSFDLKAQEVLKKIEMGQFFIGASQLMEDVTRFLKNEGKLADSGDDIRDLAFLTEFYLERSELGMKEIIGVLSQFKQTCEALHAIGAGLELVRLTGKMEIARLYNASSASDLLNELKNFQTELSLGLKQILEHQQTTANITQDLLALFFEKRKARV